MFFGFLFMLLVVGAIVAAVVLALRYMGSAAPERMGRDGGQAMDILKERFAKGEIDAKEFDERKRLLSQQ